ncbi:uncharacterized protein LOC135375383 isoform X3 [Ornithodoros turicata]|uniref:uncharacterized protein LOC135375383 isoform X3 n=1 Tax=Ornithodoros turicata TaxID=34597 RepID=UPI003138AF67
MECAPSTSAGPSRRQKKTECDRRRRAAETEEQRKQRLSAGAAAQRRKRAIEAEEERKQRLARLAEMRRKKRRADAEVRAMEAAAKRARREANPGLREAEAAAKRAKRQAERERRRNGLPVSSPAADDGLEARSVGTQIYPIRCFKSTQTSEASRLMLLLDREPTPLAGLFAGRVKHESVSVPNGQPASSTADASIEARSVGTQIYPLRCSKSTQTSEASRLMLLLDRENPQHVLWSHREPLLESCGHNAGSS